MSNGNYVSVRVGYVSKSGGNNQRRHDLRIGKMPMYVDGSESHENSVIIEPVSASVLSAEADRRRALRETKRSIKSNAGVGVAGIITFSHSAQNIINSLSREEQDALFHQSAKDIAEKLKTDLTGLVVHRDEASVHAHFQCFGYRKDGYAVSAMTRKLDLSELQDVAAGAFESVGITRGERIGDKIRRLQSESKTDEEISRAVVKRSVKRLHDELPLEIAEAEKRLAEAQAKLAKNERLIEKQTVKLAAGHVDEEKAAKRVEAYERRAEDARKRAEEEESKIKRLEEIWQKNEPERLFVGSSG